MATASIRLSLQKTHQKARYKFHKRQQTESAGPAHHGDSLDEGNLTMYSKCIRPDKLISHDDQTGEGKQIFNHFLTKVQVNHKSNSAGSKMRRINLSAYKPYIEATESLSKVKSNNAVNVVNVISPSNRPKIEISLNSKPLKSFAKLRTSQQQAAKNRIARYQLNLETGDFETWRLQIRKICGCIEELKTYDQTDTKINKWCKNYLEKKGRDLIEIFMRKIHKKKSLNNEILYYAVSNELILLNRVIQAAQIMSQKQKYFLGIELGLYKRFLEQKIALKYKLELKQVEARVQSNVEDAVMRQFARELYNPNATSSEVNSFFGDLHRMEEMYGRMNFISANNRKRFENINQSQTLIRNIIYA